LTFAPRKTCHEGSNLTLHSYHATAKAIIHAYKAKSKHFLQIFSKNFVTIFITIFVTPKNIFPQRKSSLQIFP